MAASDLSATASLVEDGRTGIVAAADAPSFAAALRRLLDAPSLDAMSAAAAERAPEYSWDRVAERVEGVYQSVTEDSPQRRKGP